MIITLVTDTFDVGNNGITVSAMRFAENLISRGHTVRVVACGGPEHGKASGPRPDGPEMYWVPELVLPIATRLARRQHTAFGKPDRETLIAAMKDADVVHIYQPWPLGIAAERIAREIGVPAIGGFHIQPENITYNLGLGWFPPAAQLVYFLLRVLFYGRFADIHCPSTFIAAQLRHHGYRARLHVISNGVSDRFRPGPARAPGAPFRILMVGRFSPEKRQEVLIKAVRKSRHAANIQLLFAGHGPREKRLRRMARKLPHPPQFGYYTQAELIALIQSCDLYVHASDVEIEGVSCLEAFACGLVPVISDSRRSATGQFALGPEHLFRAGDPASLAERIDAWIDDPEALAKASETYARYADLYAVDRTVKAIERVYARAGDAPQAPDGYSGRVYRWLSNAFYYGVFIPAMFLWTRLVLGVRSEGRSRLPRTGGMLTVCNHVHPLDSVLVAIAVFPRRLVFTSAPINLQNRGYGWMVRLLGGVAVPATAGQLPRFFSELELFLAKGRGVHFFPEGELKPYDTSLRDFKRGAFHLAAQARVPVAPISIRFTPPTGVWRLFRRKPTMVIVFGDPIDPVATDPRHDRRTRMELARHRMNELITRVAS